MKRYRNFLAGFAAAVATAAVISFSVCAEEALNYDPAQYPGTLLGETKNCNIVDMYFYDFQTGEKDRSILSKSITYIGDASDYIFYYNDDRYGSTRENPMDKFVAKLYITNPDSKYYGQTLTFEIGSEEHEINNASYFSPACQYINRVISAVTTDDLDKTIEEIESLKESIELPDLGYKIAFPVRAVGTKKNSLVCAYENAATSATCDYDYVFATAPAPTAYNNPWIETVPSDVVITMKEGDVFEIQPFLSATAPDGSKISIAGKEIQNFDTLFSTYQDILQSAITSKNGVLDNFVHYSSSDNNVFRITDKNGEELSFENRITSEVYVKAEKAGTASITMQLAASPDPEAFRKKCEKGQLSEDEKNMLIALFPGLVSQKGSAYSQKTVLNITINITVYPQSEEVDYFIEDTNIKEFDNLCNDADFSVKSGAKLKFRAEIDGNPYSSAFEISDKYADVVKVSQDSSFLKTSESTTIMFMYEKEVQTLAIPFGEQIKNVKIYPERFTFDGFLKFYPASQLQQNLNDDLLVLNKNEKQSVAEYLSTIMTDIAGGENEYGIPMFPKSNISLEVDDEYINKVSDDIISGKKDTPETEVVVYVEDTGLKIKVMVGTFEPQFFIIPKSEVSDFKELRNMKPKELEKLSWTTDFSKPNKILQKAPVEVYAFQYPYFTRKVDAEIIYGTHVVSVEEGQKGCELTIAAKDINNGMATLQLTDQRTKRQEVFSIEVALILSCGLDPAEINIRIDMADAMSVLDNANINPATAVQDLKNMVNSLNNGKRKVETITPYVNEEKYKGTMYYVFTGNKNYSSGVDAYITSDNLKLERQGEQDSPNLYSGKGSIKISIPTQVELNVTVYAFPIKPDMNNFHAAINSDSTARGVCTIIVSPNVENQTININPGYVASSKLYDMQKYTDATGKTLYYYDYEIKPAKDNVTVVEGKTVNTLIYYKERAIVPIPITGFSGNRMKTSDGSYSLSDAKLFNVLACDKQSGAEILIYERDLFEDASISNGCLTSVGNTFTYEQLCGQYNLYACIEKTLPYTVSGAVLKEGTVTVSGSQATYRDAAGQTYNSDKVLGAMINATDNHDAMYIDRFETTNGTVYALGNDTSGVLKRIPISGENVYFAVQDNINISGPAEEITKSPIVRSSNGSIASTRVNVSNSDMRRGTNSVINIGITGVKAGDCRVDVVGAMGSNCSINVKVKDKINTDADNEMATSLAIDEPSGYKYFLSVPQKTYYMSVGDTIRVPLTAEREGELPLYGEFDPYEVLYAGAIGETKTGCTAELDGQEIVITASEKGRYGIYVTSYKVYIDLSFAVIVN